MSISWINRYLKKWEMVPLALGILIIGISINHKPITDHVTNSVGLVHIQHKFTLEGPIAGRSTWGGVGAIDSTKIKLIIHGKITLTGQINLDVPSAFYVDEPFWVSLQIDLDDPPKEQVISRVYNTQLRLTGSGLTCEPTDWQGILIFKNPVHGWVTWSFKPSSAGHFPVTLSSKAIDPKIDFIPVSYSAEFAVRRRFWRFIQDTWPIFSGFFGTFLTLPGIFSFVTQWRKDRQEKKDKSAAAKSRHAYEGEIEDEDTSTGNKSPTGKKPPKGDSDRDRYN
jgi:hypothetical protein